MNSIGESIRDKESDSADTKDNAATVLLVEDTEDNRQMMRRLLEMSGFRVGDDYPELEDIVNRLLARDS